MKTVFATWAHWRSEKGNKVSISLLYRPYLFIKQTFIDLAFEGPWQRYFSVNFKLKQSGKTWSQNSLGTVCLKLLNIGISLLTVDLSPNHQCTRWQELMHCKSHWSGFIRLKLDTGSCKDGIVYDPGLAASRYSLAGQEQCSSVKDLCWKFCHELQGATCSPRLVGHICPFEKELTGSNL